MTPEVQSLMFEPFYTTKGMSSGMGLKIAQDIVNSHRGHFLVESQVRKGTKIDVLFPAIEKKEKAIITKTIDIKGHGSILVVDDATMVVDVIKSILEERGYYVKTTTQSKEALAIFAKNPNDFDLALIDVEQPILSGTELYLEMKKIKPDFKVVFFSGGAVDPLIKESWDDGVIDFFQKPFNYDTLALVVHKAMAKVRLGKPNQDGQL